MTCICVIHVWLFYFSSLSAHLREFLVSARPEKASLKSVAMWWKSVEFVGFAPLTMEYISDLYRAVNNHQANT